MTSESGEDSVDATMSRAVRDTAESRYYLRWHAAVYGAVNAMLVIVWYTTGAGFPWFLFPLAGWGVGLIGHFLQAYGPQSSWIDREAERIFDERRSRQV